MEDGGPEHRGGEPCLQVGAGDAAGLSGLHRLLPAPRDGAARGEPAEPGSSSPGSLARSLHGCVSPGLRRLLPPRPRQRGCDEDEDEEGTLSVPAALEQSFPGLRRCLCVWEDPCTETFQGHVRPQPGDAAGTAAFSCHPVQQRVAERGTTLHTLLQHRHHLHLARRYSRCLKAASDFVRQLLVLVEPPVGELGAAPPPLRELCRELRTHAGHWSRLRQRMRGDPWLRPLLLRRQESVAHMRRALLLLALLATRLAERHAEARLRALAWAGPAAAPSPALLSDLCQGLEIYNEVVGDLDLELGTAGVTGCHGATGPHSHAFPVARVLGVLAAERGRLVAGRLQPLLQPRVGGGGDEHICWEDVAVPWPPEHGAAVAAGTGPSVLGEPPGLAGELWALCREDEELMGRVLAGLVATDNLWHRVFCGPKQEKPVVAVSPEPPEPPAASPGTASGPSSSGWRSVQWLDATHTPVATSLHSQYRPLFWGAASTALGHRLPPCGTGTAVARELSRALAQANVPQECEEQLGWLCLRLLCQGVLRSWERDFSRALGLGLSDKCCGEPVPAVGPVRSRTAQHLQSLYPPLAFALRCLRPLPACPPAPGCPPDWPCLRLQVLGCCLATAQATGSWLTGRARRYLAAWALPQFLLITQGDLPLLKGEMDRLVTLVSGTVLEPRGVPLPLPPTALCHQEHQLCQQILSMGTGIQLFSGDVLRMFSTACKRVSAEIFTQTMPLGKHWRLGLRHDLPSTPSAYAVVAVQAVLGQALQDARLLPRENQVPALAQVTTAFLEAWMDHILTCKIKFSLQGALQLRADFEVARELVGSERYGLPPETRQALLALRVFQQMDGAILCLLQQPGGAASASPPRPWHPLRRCCSDNGAHPQEPGTGVLHSLESLVASGTPPSGTGVPAWRLLSGTPESYLSGRQQQWLSLRLHGARRWRVPGLPCVGSGTDT